MERLLLLETWEDSESSSISLTGCSNTKLYLKVELTLKQAAVCSLITCLFAPITELNPSETEHLQPLAVGAGIQPRTFLL